jgi:DNA-binding LacI/PurR family transcriptional regulator
MGNEGIMASVRRPTSADVANRAGVSRATVSYVLNNVTHQSIPDATRQRVLSAAAELHYTPHAAARALRAGESKLVLFINAGVPYGANLSVMIDALSAGVAASGRSLVMWQQHDPRDLATTLAHLQPVLAITLGQLDAGQRALFARAHIPSIETGAGRDPDAADAGAALQVRYLASRGHRQLGYLTTTDPQLVMFARPRLAGVRAACAELGLGGPVIGELAAPQDISIRGLAALLREWVSRPAPVTAVACYNDVYALACLAAARQSGLGVPGDLAVIGMDDEAVSAYSQPPLTTIRLHVADFARQLCARANTALNGDLAPEVSSSMHLSLVERQSS